jgi:stage II sporulation protein D
MIQKIYFLMNIFLCSTLYLAQDTLQIGLFSDKNLKNITLKIEQGSYIVYLDKQNSANQLELTEDDQLSLWIHKGKVQLRVNEKIYKKLDQVHLENTDEIASFTFISINDQSEKIIRKYYGDLIIYPYLSDRIQLIYPIQMQDYLEGVLQAEAGFQHHLEFYKAQAIISRTYALKNLGKHQKEGYNLCDQVHCQVYKGLSVEDSLILQAVQLTDQLVVVDKKNQLIDALFYSNSGGETVHSENYWLHTVDYLRATKDEFSVGQPNYLWEKRINKKDFHQYLLDKFNISSEIKYDWTHKYENRTTHFGDKNLNIPLKNIRLDWNLRSTFFQVYDLGEELLFLGKGYGHGVGLSQEGAMNMAQKGYLYKEILKYYYKNTAVIRIKSEN